MEKLVQTIRVKDGNADDVTVYEFEMQTRKFGLMPVRRARRWALDTAEAPRRRHFQGHGHGRDPGMPIGQLSQLVSGRDPRARRGYQMQQWYCMRGERRG